MQAERLDTAHARWGEAPHPLLPLSLRKKWQDEPMPDWLCAELGLPLRSTYSRLSPSVWRSAAATSERTLNALANLVRSRLAEVTRSLLIDPEVRQDAVSLADISLSTRSRNALTQAGLLDRPQRLSELTFGELLRISAIGVRSALEIACLVESAMNARTEGLAQLGRLAAAEAPPDWVAALGLIASRPWAALVSERDARFRAMLPSDATGTVLERIERILEKPDSLLSIVRGPELLHALYSIERDVERIEKLALDEALNDLLVASSRGREKQVQALSARFGWSGGLPQTLEETGRGLGVTRERIRQIESRFLRELPDCPYLPQLDAAINALEARAPMKRDDVSSYLVAQRLCRNALTPEAIIATAALLKRETDLRVEQIPGKGAFLVGSKSSARDVAVLARKLSGMAGVASVYQVTSGLSRDQSRTDEVRRILEGLSHVEFLNDDWFWVSDIPSGRNRLSNIANKILSVAQPQSVQSIREGVRRSFTFRSKSNPRYESLVTPPSDVLAAFFRHSPEFVFQESLVRSARPLSYVEELGDVDRAFVEVFRATATGVLDRRAVMEACVKRGLNENSVSLFLTYSPIVEHVGIDVWKLRGVRVDPAAVLALREANASEAVERRLLSFGWKANGRLWIAARLPYSLTSMVLGIPGPTKRYLADRKFAALDQVSGTPCGQISVNDQGTSFGYSTFFRIAGAEPGDVLLSEFDLAEERVYLSLVDEFVLDGVDSDSLQ